MNPLVTRPDDTIVLPPWLCGSIGYYALMARYGHVVVDTAMRHDKRQKAVHRYDIADTRGVVQLTVPLGKPTAAEGRPTWAHCPVSTHDEWWTRHRITLESAYGRTPYFEFLVDRFAPLFAPPASWPTWPSAIDMAREADRQIRQVLGLDNDVRWAPAPAGMQAATINDAPTPPPYWQIRADRLGFIPGLSILDLIFNLGPEAALYLKDYPLPTPNSSLLTPN